MTALPTLPTPGGDVDTWGDELNAYLTALAAQVAAATSGGNDGSYDPMGYFAAGNGVSDDTTAVVAAMNAAAADGGGTVVLRRPHMVSALSVPSNVRLASTGGGKLIHKAGAATSCVTMPGTRSKMVDVEIDGNAANQTVQAPTVVVKGTRNTVEGVYVHDAIWDGISIASGSNHKALGCDVLTTGRYGITINFDGTTPTRHVLVEGCDIEASTAGALGIVGVAEYVDFVGNTTKNHGGDGIAAYNALNRRITCTGNSFDTPGNHGIHLGGTGLVMAGNVASGVVNGHGYFIHNNDLSTAYNVTITGNSVQGTQIGEGVRVDNGQIVAIDANTIQGVARNGVMLNQSADVAVGSNVIRDNGAGSGIALNGVQRGTVVANTLRNIGGDGIKGYDDSGNFACQLVTVTGNTVVTAAGWGLLTTDSADRFLRGTNILRLCSSGAESLTGANNVLSGSNLTA